MVQALADLIDSGVLHQTPGSEGADSTLRPLVKRPATPRAWVVRSLGSQWGTTNPNAGLAPPAGHFEAALVPAPQAPPR
jgi:hypothetical protein